MKKRMRLKDDGFTLVWMATILVVLLGMVGFGTDLGWLYLNTVRAQTAVDSAALAGVVNLPGFDPWPDAIAATQANGFDPGGADTLVLTPNSENELHASLSIQVDTFFLSVLGFDHFDVTRTATAQYVKPVPLGSPDNCFGGGNLVSGCSGDTDFWAAVSGRMTKLEDGDPYSTLCDTTRWNRPPMTCLINNPDYARGPGGYAGYYLAVEVPINASDVQVHLYGGGFGSGNPGDGRWPADQEPFGGGGKPDVNTTFTLYEPDNTPLIPTDNDSAVCSRTTASLSSSGWNQMCFPPIDPPIPGIYVLHVVTTNNSSGSNQYAVRAEANGPGGDPRVYGINDMSIWSNSLSGTSTLNLAEIGEEHAGKLLELQFYDAGDANALSWYYVNDPHGDVPLCTWIVTDHLGNMVSEQTTPTLCQWQTQVANPGSHQGIYNKQWIIALIELPPTEAAMCNGSNCFWTMDLQLSQPTERTVWKARVIGNPVRLLP